MKAQQFHKLPVYTQLGSYLGKIVDIKYDQTKNPELYFVKVGFFKNPLAQTLQIHSSQVIRITDKKMIVKDTLTPTVDKIKSAKIALAND